MSLLLRKTKNDTNKILKIQNYRIIHDYKLINMNYICILMYFNIPRIKIL